MVVSPHRTLGFLLHDTARLLRKRFEQRARDLGLTRSQWQVMAYLSTSQGIAQGKLAGLLEIEAITLVRMIDKLEARGLIERRQHQTDRRIWLLHLTEAAHPLLDAMRDLGDLTKAEALAGLSSDEQSELIKTLTHIKTNLLDACARPVETERTADHG